MNAAAAIEMLSSAPSLQLQALRSSISSLYATSPALKIRSYTSFSDRNFIKRCLSTNKGIPSCSFSSTSIRSSSSATTTIMASFNPEEARVPPAIPPPTPPISKVNSLGLILVHIFICVVLYSNLSNYSHFCCLMCFTCTGIDVFDKCGLYLNLWRP